MSKGARLHFIVFVWTGKNDSNTLHAGHVNFQNIRIHVDGVLIVFSLTMLQNVRRVFYTFPYTSGESYQVLSVSSHILFRTHCNCFELTIFRQGK